VSTQTFLVFKRANILDNSINILKKIVQHELLEELMRLTNNTVSLTWELDHVYNDEGGYYTTANDISLTFENFETTFTVAIGDQYILEDPINMLTNGVFNSVYKYKKQKINNYLTQLRKNSGLNINKEWLSDFTNIVSALIDAYSNSCIQEADYIKAGRAK
jgi:hypothetical protein